MKESRNKSISLKVEPSIYDAAEALCSRRPAGPAGIAYSLFSLWVECCQAAGRYIDPVDLLEKPHYLRMVAEDGPEYGGEPDAKAG